MPKKYVRGAKNPKAREAEKRMSKGTSFTAAHKQSQKAVGR